MSKGVIDVLEAVEVAKQHGDFARGRSAPSKGVLDAVAE
jgi:hypothetical protein